jgi:hypothetical protein
MLAGVEEAIHAGKPYEVSGGKTAIGAMLESLIDYAGLYPPASLDMRRAVGNYLAYRDGRHSDILGRFIIDASRIDELRSAAGKDLGNLRLSVLVPSGADGDCLAALLDDGVRIESVETKRTDARSASEVIKNIPERLETYVEWPMERWNEEALEPEAESRERVKLRMGGVVPDAFPSPESVARVLDGLERSGIPFKATAGLHHPIRSRHRLAYTADSPTGTMHGFVNLLCAAALIHTGGSATEAVQILEEQDFRAWSLSSDAFSWRSRRWTIEQISATRKRFVSFGSCSFEEPIRDLEAMGWL